MKRPRNAEPAVSIIACTKRPDCMNNLLLNYGRQNYKNKELIVILNDPEINPAAYRSAAKKYKNVRIYRMPNRSLGKCLNFGVKAAAYDYIAKFDDDDHYSANYLADSMRAMQRTDADLVGKRAHYMYLQGSRLLLLRYCDKEHQFVRMVQGATLLVKRHVFRQVAFPDQTRGECVKFCIDSAAKGFKIYACGRSGYMAVRKENMNQHTWRISDKNLLHRGKVKVWKAANFKQAIRLSRLLEPDS
ncbi:glycosyltransferase [Paenibacillus thailandensis]|uniref:Glycosyltransferase n=1 Tax=Paenibacillus thailandensis TaxID=393250 RepID=A0ABW5QVH4_9BACL